MFKAYILTIAAIFGTSVLFAADLDARARVLKDRVNVRAGASTSKEVLFQVNSGESLEATGRQAEWIQIVVPERVSVWVYSQFVDGSTIKTDKVNLRAGANINYTRVGQLNKGDTVHVISRKEKWTEISAPPVTRAWIHESLLELLGPEHDKPDHTPDQADLPVPGTTAPTTIPEIHKPETNQVVQVEEQPQPLPLKYAKSDTGVPVKLEEMGLVPMEGQAKVETMTGKLRWTSDLLIKRPSELRLARTEAGRSVTSCYVFAERSQMESLIGRQLEIRGKVYWLRGVRYPVLVPDVVTPL